MIERDEIVSRLSRQARAYGDEWLADGVEQLWAGINVSLDLLRTEVAAGADPLDAIDEAIAQIHGARPRASTPPTANSSQEDH